MFSVASHCSVLKLTPRALVTTSPGFLINDDDKDGGYCGLYSCSVCVVEICTSFGNNTQNKLWNDKETNPVSAGDVFILL